MIKHTRLCLLLAASLALTGLATAQDVTKGSLGGTVKDATGAVIAGADVKLTSPNGDRETKTGANGDYVFLNLIPGSDYTLSVNQSGFTPARINGISVSLNQRATADVQLQISSAATTVEVSESGGTLVDLQSTTIGGTVDESLYKNVPVGRNISSVVNLVPGVSDGIGTGAANPSINGASGLENQYVINGANVTDPAFGGFGTFSRVFGSLGTGINFDFIQEVQVRSGGFEAQYGQALGGIVNVITKSGTNELHGGVYGYFQPRQFEAARQNSQLGLTVQTTRLTNLGSLDYGADLGGYLIKNKLFWYGGINPIYNYSYRRAPQQFANYSLGEQEVRTRVLNYTGKLNWNISPNHQLEGSVFGDPSNVPIGFTRFSSLAANDNLRQSGLDYGSRTWTGRYNGVLTTRWIITANFSDYYNSFTETPKANGYQIVDNVPVQEGTGSQITRNGLGSLENSESRVHQFSVTSTHNVTFLGTHQFDIGGQFEDVNYDDIHRYTGADFTLPNLPIFGAGAGQTTYGAALIRTHSVPTDLTSPIVLRVTRGLYSNPATSVNTRYYSAFVQDSWTLGHRLTIKPGIRYEDQQMTGRNQTYIFAPNWAPRIGVIYDPTGSRKNKIFANWGRFFEKVPLDMAIRAFSFESEVRGEFFRDQSGAIDLSPANYVGNTVTGQRITFSGGPDNLTQVAPGTKSQYQNEVVGGYERDLGKGSSLSTRFVYRHLRRIIEDVSPISITQALAGFPQQYVIANPSSKADLINNTSGASGPDGQPDGFPNPSRIYKGLQVQYTKRFTSNFQFFANYTLSKLYGNYEGLFRNDNGQEDPNITSLFDFTNTDGLLTGQFTPGVLPADRRHVAKLYGNYEFSSGFLRHLNVGAGWQIQTGTPISELAAHPAYDNAGELPVGPRGKLGRTDTTYPLDLNLSYAVPFGEKRRLKFQADMFNLFNQSTVIRVNQFSELDSTTKNPDFLKQDSQNFQYPYLAPFRARLSVRFEF